jgi:hypothetical protein
MSKPTDIALIKLTSTASNELIGPLNDCLEFIFNLCDGRRGLELTELINRTKLCMCSDQRDRVYSLLSLLPTGKALGIEPDYTKSVNTVYRDTTVSMIKTAMFHNLNILTTIEGDEQRRRVPSWTPDVCFILLLPNLLKLMEYHSTLCLLLVDQLGLYFIQIAFLLLTVSLIVVLSSQTRRYV